MTTSTRYGIEGIWAMFCRSIIIIVFLVGCSGLEYISLTDTTEDHWQEVRAVAESSPQQQANGKKIRITKERTTDGLAANKLPRRQYHTPLAGTRLNATIVGGKLRLMPFLKPLDFAAEKLNLPIVTDAFDLPIKGVPISIAARDRRNVVALNIGTTLFTPKLGGNTIIPFGAFFVRQQTQDDRRRFRAILTGVVNYIDFAEGTWNDAGFEALLHWENFTVPLPSTEIIDGKKAEFTEMQWGRFFGGIGFGWRTPLAPYHFDNDFRVQFFYEPGYLYSHKSDETGSMVELPPDTALHQLRLRLHFDTFDRNFLELPHQGWAWGADLVFGRKECWSDHRFSDIYKFERDDTRDYLRLNGYLTAAFPVPFLSERHRLLLSGYAGWSPSGNWDRFTTFRLGGGVPPSESEDMARPVFSGAGFDQFSAERYLLGVVEYRLELDFYIFLHVRASFLWGKFGMLKINELTTTDFTSAFSVALTTGFIWNSLLYAEYTIDDGFIRRDRPGHGVLISWSKAF